MFNWIKKNKSKKKFVSKTIGELKKAMFNFGQDKNPSKIEEIGYEWVNFGVLKGDIAKRVNTGDSSNYTIIYKSGTGYFPPHFHSTRESGIILEGSMKINTPDEEIILEEGDVYSLDAGTWHSATMLKPVVIILTYGDVEEWEGSFNKEV